VKKDDGNVNNGIKGNRVGNVIAKYNTDKNKITGKNSIMLPGYNANWFLYLWAKFSFFSFRTNYM